MKKKRNQNLCFAQDARRKNEIAQYGKLISLRPAVTHKSKKAYDRNGMKNEMTKIITNNIN